MLKSETFGAYDFGLNEEQEARARRLHDESIIIDTLFQGPCGRRSFTEEMVEQLRREYERHHDAERAQLSAWRMPVEMALEGRFPDLEACWNESGVTAGTRQIIGKSSDPAVDPFEEAVKWFAFDQAQFDRLPWMVKALKAQDIRRAKTEGKHAGFLSTQDTIDIGLNLDRLNVYHDFGMTMIQLTYNLVNFVGGGCTDRADCGVTDYGVKFIGRMNDLGMIVDVGHCGRKTTLDACEVSDAPVVASHTSAAGVYPHDRAKSDEELEAIAATGGYVGVYCLPAFLSDDPDASVETFLDHVDHVARLIGPEHVGIGSDWPLQAPHFVLDLLEEWLLKTGFRSEHGLKATGNLTGFDDYRDFPNITRGLVSRGYTDREIEGILGANFLRVFEKICG
jgi:membrane dipeptidase